MAKEIKSDYKVIGVMAGSSMDGLDVAEVIFRREEKWNFEVCRTETLPYGEEIDQMLKSATHSDPSTQKKADVEFGEWIGQQLQSFDLKDCDFVAVHGHTLIHKPSEGISWQLGHGQIIADLIEIPTVTEFRTRDVQLGGQGAPLVPIGDFELFYEYDACLNLGGIANVSVRDQKTAWDICPCNQVLNFFAQQVGYPYDEGGMLARKGNQSESWKSKISSIPFFSKTPPKSLPNSFIDQQTLEQVDPLDGLATYTSFIVEQSISDIGHQLPANSKILVTGGGAYNKRITELLNENKLGLKFVVPDSTIVDFKEAIIFGFLGLLKWRDEVNVLASVTGASKDSSSGVIHYPK